MLTTKKHNSSSIKFYLFLILTFTQLITNVYPRCYDYPSPLSRKKVWSNCSMVEELDGENLTGGPTTGNSTNMFQVSFNCGITDATLCNKVKNAFDTAGQIISSIVTFNTPVMVNASFFDFCLKLNSCPSGGLVILGGAAPARTILLQDDDGMARLYPQALVKQYQFPKHPQFGPFDILAQFNSNGASYWFQGDPPITPNQQDFLYVILHEMIHGLGFTSNWLDYINDDIEALTPEVGINGATGVNGPVSFSGFFESAFDRYMINIPQAKRTSLTTDQLNKFAGTIPVNTGLKFTSANDFVSKFRSSSQYKLAQNMLTLSITKNSLGFIPHDTNKTSDAVVLETSLSPFRQGSSVSHVDYNTYNNTNDFLMKFLADKGVDLNTLITMRSPDKQNRNDLTLAIGPKLKTVLETLGYTTTNYKSTYKPNTAIVSNTLTSSGNSLQPNDGSNSTTTNTNTNTNVPNQKTSVGSVTNKPNIIFALIFMVISISMKSIYV